MSEVALQADVVNIPNNSLSLLATLKPFLQALSADNVNPLAVDEVHTIGTYFHMNGDLAAKIPDLLCRSNSMRLERLKISVGWQKGDTASFMAQTAGGRAAALLCLFLVELYDTRRAGEVLYKLSSMLLVEEQRNSSINQLAQVSQVLAAKLAAIGFGNHLATVVTRLREAYLNMDVTTIPTEFLDIPTQETIASFLQGLSVALTEDQSILRLEGCKGIGYILSLVLALCPEDVWVYLENEPFFQGERRNIVVVIGNDRKDGFTIEKLINGSKPAVKGILSIVATNPGVHHAPHSFRWEGHLADRLTLCFAGINVWCTTEITTTCVELISLVANTISGDELYNISSRKESKLPKNGFLSLLGPFPSKRIRDALLSTFRIEPSLVHKYQNYVDAYTELVRLMEQVICSSQILRQPDGMFLGCWKTHTASFELEIYSTCGNKKCKLWEFWRKIGCVIGDGISALFIKPGIHATVTTKFANRQSCLWRTIIRAYAYVTAQDVPKGAYFYSNRDFHKEMLFFANTINRYSDSSDLGLGSGSSVIFPSTLLRPQLEQYVEYLLVDGRFSDGRNCFEKLISEGKSRQRTTRRQLSAERPIRPSSDGTHTDLCLTVRETAEALLVKTSFQANGKLVEVDFLDIHLGFLALTYSRPCSHRKHDALSDEHSRRIFTTSVAQPQGTGRVISLALTRANPESQFLCCSGGLRTVFQADSCLNCCIEEAQAEFSGDSFLVIVS